MGGSESPQWISRTGLRSDTLPSIPFYWLKQLTQLSTKSRAGERCCPLSGRDCKVTRQRAGIQDGGEDWGPVISNTGTIAQRKGDITSGRRNGSKLTEMMMPITFSLHMP